MKTANIDNFGMIAGRNDTTTDFLWHLSGGFEERLGGAVSDNTWNAVTDFTTEADYVLVFDDAALKFRLYRNGTELNSPGFASGGHLGQYYINTLGSAYTGTSFGLVGTLSYFYIWSGRVLDATEAGALHTDPYAFLTTGGGSVKARSYYDMLIGGN